MRIILAALATLLCSACDQVVERHFYESRMEVRNINCNYSGICFSCLPGFGPKCGMKYSAFCDGHQDARIKITPVDLIYESGDRHHIEQTETVERLGACI